MDWARYVVELFHILAGIFWFGAILYIDFVVIPAFLPLPPAIQRPASQALAKRAMRVVPPAAVAVIVLGILRGTIWGPIQSVDALLNTNYGLTWLAALVLAIATYAWGDRTVAGLSTRLFNDDSYWVLSADGQPPAKTTQLLATLRRNGMVELVLFLLIIAAMVLLSMGQ
jgi:putative copper export protein